MNLYKNEVFISINKSGKCDMGNKEEVEHLTSCNHTPPRFGYNWFYVLPKVYTNFRRLDNTTNVFTISWLQYCWYLDSYIWFWERR